MLVPAVHGHAAGGPDHVHARVVAEHAVDASDHGHTAVPAPVEAAVHDLGLHVDEAHAEGDLPLALEVGLLLAVLAVTGLLVPASTATPAGGVRRRTRPRPRGSPVSRHEVARI